MRTTMKQTKSLCAVGMALLLVWWWSTAVAQSPVQVEAVGLTVADMDRSVAFYRNVLTFEVISDVEVAGAAYEQLQGVFGLRLRVVRLRLGEEAIVLTEYLTPKGRPAPAGARSNDRWFQHIAIIASDWSI